MDDYDKVRLAQLIAKRGYQKGRFELASGQISDYYIDLGKVMKIPHALKLMTLGLIKHMDDIDKVGGPSSGADTLVAGLLLHADDMSHKYEGWDHIEGFLIKKPREGGVLEGEINRGDRCLIIEDVTTTGGSSITACRHVAERGAVVSRVVSVLDRGQGAKQNFEGLEIPFFSLLTLEDVLKYV